MCWAAAGTLLKDDSLRVETSWGSLSVEKVVILTVYECICRCLFDIVILVTDMNKKNTVKCRFYFFEDCSYV
jgi:hypothetical protein